MPAKLSIEHEALASLCRRHGIVRLAFFGSVLREDFAPHSDVDVLVEFAPDQTPGFFAMHAIEQELVALLGGRRVDLMTFKGLNPRIRERILASAEVQFAA